MEKKERFTLQMVVLANVVLATGIFLVDLSLPLGAAVGVPYVALVMISWWLPQSRHVILVAAATTALTILGFFFSPSGEALWVVLTNRSVAIFVIWMTAMFCVGRKQTEQMLKKAQDELEQKVTERTIELKNEIAERKKAAKTLSEREQLFRAVFQDTSVGIALVDKDGRPFETNPALQQLLGYTNEAFQNLTFADFTHPDDLETDLALYGELVGGKRNHYKIEKRYYTKEGKLIWGLLSVSLVRTPTGEPLFAVGLVEDITEAKEASEQIQRLATVVRDSNDAITLQDFDGKILAWNKGAEKIYGWPEAEALKMNINQIAPAKTQAERSAFTKTLLGGDPLVSFETQRNTKDGQQVDIWLTATIQKDAHGKPSAIATTERDITKYKQVEKEIRTLNQELEQRVSERTAELETANKELQAFSYSISHDLRAPLRAIDGFSDILIEEYLSQLPQDAQRYLGLIQENAVQMGQLIDDLLTFSRLSRQPLQTEPVDPANLVRNVLEDLHPLQKDRQIEVTVKDLPTCQADPALLRQVFTNLLSNALKYTRPRDVAKIEVGSQTEDGRTVYAIKDNGTGFDMRYAEKLFGVFQRLHRAEEFEGTGVGLAIVQRIIHRHGGRIWAEAEVDQGAQFYFTIKGDSP